MELKAAGSQLNIGINIIATMATTMTVGWYLGARYFNDDVLVKIKIPFQKFPGSKYFFFQKKGVCCGIICCIIGMMVDMWLFVINGNAVDRHMEKKAKKESRTSKLLHNYPGLVKYD